jgi:putative ABC transport system permease protein
MSAFLRDVRYALRRARSRAGFTVIAVVSLGLGIGVNTAAFSLVNAIILRKTPVARADRVAELDMMDRTEVSGPMSYIDVKDLRAQSAGMFTQLSVASFAAIPRDLGDHVETVIGTLVNGDYFPLIGLPPVVGRLLGPEDDVTRGAHPVVVLGYDYWRSAFGGDRGVVGRELRLAGHVYTVVGVAPKSIDGLLPGLAPAMYAPILMIDQLEPTIRDELAARGGHSYFVKARLTDGQTMAGATALVERFTADMRRLYPEYWPAHVSLRVVPVSQIAVSPLVDGVVVPAATALMVVVGLVLVIACANLASFLLAQARDRRREIAIRLALGASRRALVRQLLVESLIVAVAGGVLGTVLSSVGLRALLSADLPIPLPISLDVSVDVRVLTFVIVASVLAGVLFGLLPALQATRPDVIETIKNENAGAKPGRRFTMRGALVVAQTATSLVLLVTAALFLRSFAAQARVDAGFGASPAGMVWMALPTDRYPAARREQAVADIERRMRALDDVTGVGSVEFMMLNALGNNSRIVNVDGFQPPKGTTGFDIDATTADSGFFDAAGLKLLQGRTFNSSDGPGREQVVVINEAMAEKFWPGQNSLGRTFRGDSTVFHVIGVFKTTKVRSLSESPRPFFLMAMAQSGPPFFMLVARTRGDAARTATRMVTALRAFDPSLMIVQAKTMQAHLAVMLLPARLGAVAFALFAGLALLLATIGVYGVVRYAVARRTREVAIRLAIGARPDGIVRMLMSDGLVLVGSGAVIGLVLAALASRGLESLLFGVRAIDPVAFVVAPVVLVGVGVLAAFLPARRASRVDPASSLRAE